MRRLLRRKFVQDTLVLQVTSLFMAGTYFVTSVLTAQHLGDAGVGRWEFARTLFLFAYVLVTMGVGNATVARYSQAIGQQDRDACVESLAALVKLGLIAFVLVTLGGFFALPVVAEWWTGDRDVGVLAWVLCTAGLFEVVRTLATAAFVGARQMSRYAGFDITVNLMRVGLIALVVFWDDLGFGPDLGLEGIAAAFMANLVFGGAVALYAYGRARRTLDAKVAPPPLSEVWGAVPSASLSRLFNVSFLLALNKAMNDIVPRVGIVLVAGYSFADGGAYSVANYLAWGLAQLVGGASRAMLPAMGFKLGSSDESFDRMGRTFKRVTLASTAIFGLITALAIPLVPWILNTFYPDEFSVSFAFFLGLVIGNFFIGTAVVFESFWIYSGRLRACILFNLAWVVVWTVTVTSLSDTLGPKGIAVAVGLYRVFLVFHLVYIWLYFRRVRLQDSAPSDPTP